MPDYSSLSSQIDAVKSEITSSLNASTYTAQDLIYISSALNTLGNMLGVNDVVAATAAKVQEIIDASASSVITESTTSRTLAYLTDQNNIIKTSSGSATTITVPANSTSAFPVGSSVEIIQGGSGRVTISPAGGVTIRNADGLNTTRAQWSSASLVKIATDEWILAGDLAV